MPTLIDISLSRIMIVCGIIILALTCIGLIITLAHMVLGAPTKADLQELEARLDIKMENMKLEIIAAIREDVQANKDNMNTQMIQHVQNLHTSKPHPNSQ